MASECKWCGGRVTTDMGVFIATAVLVGGGVFAYCLLWIFIDNAPTPDDYETRIRGL